MFSKSTKTQFPSPNQALPGRQEPIEILNQHAVLNTVLLPPFPDFTERALFGMGCFWGAERKFWLQEGVFSTAVGYGRGFTPNPTYQEVCSGMTGHNELVQVIFDPNKISYAQLLATFWQSHNPTQGMRQGNDIGTQYRSGIYVYNNVQMQSALASRDHYQQKLRTSGYPEITTEILQAPIFYYAEDYHQQYLAKNPNGYCGLGGCGVSYDD